MTPTATRGHPAAGGLRGVGFSGVGLFVILVVLCWSVLPALLQSVPHADNVEQLNWAHALQWGYLKHPPLPTALLWTASTLAGPSAFLTYFLAMVCVGAALLLIWRCALVIGGASDDSARAMALAAVLLSSANYYLMGRGSFLNHNTVMLPFVAASAWAVLHIVRDVPDRPAWPLWLLLGLVQALGLLTKYQMAIIIAANAAALLACGPWRGRGRAGVFAAHVLLCSAATVLPLVPHFLWLQQHAFSSFTYAGQNLLADLPPMQRLVHTLGFIAQQIGRLAPVLAALGIALAWQRIRPVAALASNAPSAASAAAASNGRDADTPASGAPGARGLAAGSADPRLARALLYLALVPLAIVVALALLGGVATQNHWGASATLLMPLLLATRLPAAAGLQPMAALVGAAAVHLIAVAWNIVVAFTSPGFHHSFAARPLAAQALAHWQQHVRGPLRVVVGPDWDAGAIALYLPGNPAVLASGDRRQAPWISDDELARCGALVLWRPGQPAQDQVGADIAARIENPVVLQDRAPRGIVSSIGAGILAPTAPGCTESAP